MTKCHAAPRRLPAEPARATANPLRAVSRRQSLAAATAGPRLLIIVGNQLPQCFVDHLGHRCDLDRRGTNEYRLRRG